MSKQIRTLIIASIAIVVLGALLAVLLLLPQNNESSTSSVAVESDTKISLMDKSSDSSGTVAPIKKIVVKTPDEEFTISPNSEDEMVVEKFKDLPINSTTIDSLVSSLTTITATEKVNDAPESEGVFGFDTPLATVSVTYRDGTEYSFEIGNETPLKDGYYFRETGKTAIYIVESTLATAVLQKSTDFIGTAMYSAPTVDKNDSEGKAVLRNMKLSGTVRASSPFAFRMATEDDSTEFSYANYVITSPYLRGTNSTAMETLTANLTSLTADSAVVASPTAADLTKYGFDTPYSVAKLTVAVSTSKTVASSDATSSGTTETSYYNVREHTITLGNKDTDGNYYAMADDIKVIYLVAPDSVLWAKTQYDDIADPLLFMKDITKVSSVTVNIGGTETLFNLQHFPDKEEKDDMLTVTAGGTKYDTSNFRTLYQVLMSVARNSASTAAPTGTPAVVITIKPTDTSATTIVAKFYSYSASLYTCQIQTGETYMVKAASIDEVETQLANYLAGKTVVNN